MTKPGISTGYSLHSEEGFAAFAGSLFVLPFVALNAVIGDRIEPFFSWIRPGVHTSAGEYVLLVVVLMLLPVGAWVALRPMLVRGADGRRRFLVVNALVAGLLIVLFAMACFAFGLEVYRCEILQIPNCD